MADNYGLYSGSEVIVQAKVDSSTTAIVTGDFLIYATAGYVKKAAAGDLIVGIALEDCAVPTSDGLATIKMGISQEAVYKRAVGTGTITQAMAGLTCDIAGARTIDVTASADDCIVIVQPLVSTNEALVTHRYTRAGVV